MSDSELSDDDYDDYENTEEYLKEKKKNIPSSIYKR